MKRLQIIFHYTCWKRRPKDRLFLFLKQETEVGGFREIGT